MKKKRIILLSVVILAAGFLIYTYSANEKRSLIFNIDKNKVPVTSISFKQYEDRQGKMVGRKADVKKIMNFINSIEYKEVGKGELTDDVDYTLLLCRDKKTLATMLKFNENYINLYGKNYESNKEIVEELKILFKESE